MRVTKISEIVYHLTTKCKACIYRDSQPGARIDSHAELRTIIFMKLLLKEANV